MVIQSDIRSAGQADLTEKPRFYQYWDKSEKIGQSETNNKGAKNLDNKFYSKESLRNSMVILIYCG